MQATLNYEKARKEKRGERQFAKLKYLGFMLVFATICYLLFQCCIDESISESEDEAPGVASDDGESN